MLEDEIVPSVREVQCGILGIRNAARDVDGVISNILLCGAALIYGMFQKATQTTYSDLARCLRCPTHELRWWQYADLLVDVVD
jgi:hypothetical protein